MDANRRSTFFHDPQIMNPVQLGANSILSLSQTRRVLETVLAHLERLQPDDFINFMKDFYRSGLGKFGDDWHYTDQLSVLLAAASLIQVETYLEIGVFRGRSFSLVGSQAQQACLYAFDMWVENYSGMENPGPELVRAQLVRVGYQGQATFVSGPSRETIPAFFAQNPQLYFDMVTVDGDHSEEGARTDLENVLPRIKLGGVLVFDDIVHPKHPILEEVWDEVVGANLNFVSAKYTQVGHGVAVAVRRANDTALDAVRGEREERAQELAVRLKAAEVELQENQVVLDNTFKRLEAIDQDRAARLDVINRQEAERERMQALLSQKDAELRWLPVRALRWLRRIFAKGETAG